VIDPALPGDHRPARGGACRCRGQGRRGILHARGGRRGRQRRRRQCGGLPRLCLQLPHPPLAAPHGFMEDEGGRGTDATLWCAVRRFSQASNFSFRTRVGPWSATTPRPGLASRRWRCALKQAVPVRYCCVLCGSSYRGRQDDADDDDEEKKHWIVVRAKGHVVVTKPKGAGDGCSFPRKGVRASSPRAASWSTGRALC
jgi:hypothetical protein